MPSFLLALIEYVVFSVNCSVNFVVIKIGVIVDILVHFTLFA